MSHTMTFSCDVIWRARLFSPFLHQPNVGARFTELTVESQLRQQKLAGTVSPVSSVCLQSALCLCCTFSVCGGSSCPVSGKTHTGYKVLSHHVSVWSLIPQQYTNLMQFFCIWELDSWKSMSLETTPNMYLSKRMVQAFFFVAISSTEYVRENTFSRQSQTLFFQDLAQAGFSRQQRHETSAEQRASAQHCSASPVKLKALCATSRSESFADTAVPCAPLRTRSSRGPEAAA